MKQLQKIAIVPLLFEKTVLLLPFLALIISCCDAAALRLHATHADAGRGLTNRELLHRMAVRSKARAVRLLSGRAASARVDPGPYTDGVPDTEYLVHLAVGTPPQPVQLILDTGSDLVWTQCQPCQACFDQTLPYFDTFNSSTFALLSCHLPMCHNLPWSSCGKQNWGNNTCVYVYSYGDNSITTGHLDADTFTFAAADGTGQASVPGLAFGCGLFNNGIFRSNETGIAGFGRGALSLPSQLKVENFSYCFTAITGSEPSTVLLGAPTNLYSNAGVVVQSTPLIQNSSSSLSAYYISLKGITVGSTRLPIPESAFALKQDGTGGTIIDSGTGMTSLPQDAYKLVHDAFVAQVKLPVRNSTASSFTQLCFSAPPRAKPDVPKLVLHFEAATLDLPRENYMFEIEDTGGSFTCLAINAGDGLTIIGNYQQQNMHVLYDLANNKLSFVPAQCNRL
ncbi:aspartic proteinase nepenthesin-1-like [Phragmites australis]|uniref:aspartic proteinase nepenthesin-1-like n=1 Tax=Phragmites australis TaxID=29695 RepID=UPI002D77CDC3|nr:aspartic proteinase nepenthesin-1-like [Phragmites australis]